MLILFSFLLMTKGEKYMNWCYECHIWMRNFYMNWCYNCQIYIMPWLHHVKISRTCIAILHIDKLRCLTLSILHHDSYHDVSLWKWCQGLTSIFNFYISSIKDSNRSDSSYGKISTCKIAIQVLDILTWCNHGIMQIWQL